MKLDSEFIRLPLRFDADRLAEEIAQIPESDWRPHPQGFAGNSALPLIAVGGDPLNDAVRGAMRPTPLLARCPYLRQVLASFGCVLGRTRLMRLDGNAEATAHVDTNYYWQRRVRIHVPVVTNPDVQFLCGERSVNMAIGESWLFDTWRRHNVVNPRSDRRIHLVADATGSPDFWDMVAQSERPFGPQPAALLPPRLIAFEPGHDAVIATEEANFPVVMSPEEMDGYIAQMSGELDQTTARGSARLAELAALAGNFQKGWHGLWEQHGTAESGWAACKELLAQFRDNLQPYTNELPMPNGTAAAEFLLQAVVRAAFNPELATPQNLSRFDRPVFIVSAPRSGSSLLFETLARSPDLWTVGGESHEVFENIPAFKPENRDWSSNRLTTDDAGGKPVARLRDAFASRLRDRDARFLPADNSRFRMLEKTPKNALRVPLLAAAFPDAVFIYLYRAPRDNLSSMLDAWRSGRFVTYPALPGWSGEPWSLLLVPGWREVSGQPLPEIVAHQWLATQQQLLDDLAQIPSARWCTLRYEDFLAAPQQTAEQLCAFCGVRWDQDLSSGPLPHSRHTLTPPDPDKWRRNAAELEQLLPRVQAVAAQAEAVVARQQVASRIAPERIEQIRLPADAAALRSANVAQPVAPEQALGSEFTTNLPGLFKQLQISLVVTTYQAGKMILVREDEGKLNTHFLLYEKPMGMAATSQRLAVGTAHSIEVYKNIPDVAKKKQDPNRHDACYVHQHTHNTGDIDIHEMAWARDGQLWFINTRFSTLCTLDLDHSFVPRWRPKFVTALTPEDRCHLNGLCLVDGKPRYVTALGEEDSHEGWRRNKASGGVMIDLTTDRIVARGLSMPHSPRLHEGRIWVLESGKGSLGVVDLAAGSVATVAEVPGFTRGLDFYGNLAFIGLSQVRETAAFSGLPITERAQERNCGVWVVNLQNGQTLGFLRFKGAVQEIFSVQVLRDSRFPDILERNDPLLATSYVVPTEALRQVPRNLLKT